MGMPPFGLVALGDGDRFAVIEGGDYRCDTSRWMRARRWNSSGHDWDKPGADLICAAQRKLEMNRQKYPVEKARGTSRTYTDF